MKKQTKIWTILSSCLAVVALALGITCSCLAFSPNSSIEPQIAAGGPTSTGNWADNAATSFYRGSGTQSSPFQIRTPAQLAYLIEFAQNNDTGGCYVNLTGNVDMKQYYWTPVPEFKGVFDGGGYTISGLYINNSGENHKGFFENIENASILNVKISTSDIVVRDAAGVIAANAANSIISHCKIAADVSIQGNSGIGGIVGNAIGCDISFCSNDGSVTGTEGRIGGIVGRASESEIRFSYNSGVVSGYETAGGIVGEIDHCGEGTQGIHDCYNTGNITARSIAGGIAGRADSTLITRIYNAGELNGDCVGGIVGRTDRATITNSLNIGKMPVSEVVGYSSAYGEIIGEGNFTEIKGCFYLLDDENGEARNEIVGVNSACEITSTMPTSYDRLYNYARQSSFYGLGTWDSSEAWTNVFDSYWDVGTSENDGLPVLLIFLEDNVINYKTVYIANNYSPNRAFVYTVLTEPNQKTVTLSSSIFTRNGYTLTKFTTAVSGTGTSYNVGAELNVTNNLTLYAQWSINTYTLTFNPNGGSVSSTSLSYNIESTSALPTPTRAGFEFLGWKPSSSVGGWYSYSTYAGGTSVNGKYATVTLVAQWKGEKWFGKVSGKNFASSGHAGTASDPYTIDSAGDLAQLSLDVYSGNKYSGKVFKQTTNINLGGEEWIPIGNSSSKYFAATYDGGNYTIKAMTITNPYQYCGLFGYICYATIKNINLKNLIIENTYTSSVVTGGLVGCSDYGSGGLIQNCSVNGAINVASGYVGGIIGGTHQMTLTNCKFDGQITGSGESVGGIIGYEYYDNSQNLYDCVVSATLESNKNQTYIGGLAGLVRGGEVKRLICDVIIKATGKFASVGAFVGGQYYSYTVSFFDCMATGMLYTADSLHGAGFIGIQNTAVEFTNCSFVGSSNAEISYWDSVDEKLSDDPSYSTTYRSAIITNCYCQINDKGVYKGTDFSGFTVVPNMNDDLPMQNSLFAIAVGGQTSDYVVNHLKGKGFTLVS